MIETRDQREKTTSLIKKLLRAKIRIRLTDQELHLEVIVWNQRSCEADVHDEHLTPSDHQLVAHVLIGGVVRLVVVLPHVHAHHAQSV